MSEFPEQTWQSDWVLPPNVGSNGISNVASVSVSSTPTIIDLTTLPPPSNFYDTYRVTRDGANPLGHYVNIQAQTADVYFVFGPSVASLTTGQVSAVTISAAGSGYAAAPTVTFTGGGGSGATGTAVLSGGNVAAISIVTAGSGYTSAPTVVFTTQSGSGAAGTAVLGTSPAAATTNTVSANGTITQSAGTCAWIPVSQTLPVKVPAGSPNVPHGQNSAWRYLAVVTSSGAAVARIWQSSP